jgi:3-hydroxyisobutyrate dehydrogenase-like beta-hydroxyacid dehydrogenase
MRVAVLGLGEAGAMYARAAVDSACAVTGFDPIVHGLAEVDHVDSIESAVSDAELVLSLVGGEASRGAGTQALAAMRAGALFADMNTVAPQTKSTLATIAASRGVLFADVAIMAPVPRAGARTPLLVAGAGADRFAAIFPVSTAPIESVGPVAGAAAELKLLRSVFMKGLAALVFESVEAAEKIDSRDWMLSEIANELGESGQQLVERLIDGTTKHAVRREHEMTDAERHLAQVGSPAWMTRGTVQWLHRIASGSA